MQLIIFDIDGTLAETVALDERCFRCAVVDTFGVEDFFGNWESFSYSTDSGVFSEIMERYHGREVTKEELTRVEDAFFKNMKEEVESGRGGIREIVGAVGLLEALQQMSGVAVGIATGGFRSTARYKLGLVGVDVDSLPWASANDAFSRDEIILASQKRVQEFYKVNEFSSCTYVGDGVWDAKSSKNLGYQFIGRGTGEKGEVLRSYGAVRVFEDFKDRDAFINLVSDNAWI